MDNKEAYVEKLKKEVAQLKRKARLDQENIEGSLSQSPVYQTLHSKANKGVPLTEEEWHSIHILIIDVLPGFYQFISSKQYSLNTLEYRTCILFRLHVTALSVSNVLSVHPSYVTKLCKRILNVFFNCDGTSKDLSKKLSEIY